MNIIQEIYNGITIQNAWVLMGLILVGKTIVGALDYKRLGEFSWVELFSKGIDDIKFLVITYMFFALYHFAPSVEVFDFIGRLSTAVIIAIEVKKTYEILQRKAHDNGLGKQFDDFASKFMEEFEALPQEEKIEVVQYLNDKTIEPFITPEQDGEGFK